MQQQQQRPRDLQLHVCMYVQMYVSLCEFVCMCCRPRTCRCFWQIKFENAGASSSCFQLLLLLSLTSLSLALVFLLLLPPRAVLSVSAVTSAGAKGRWLLCRLCLSCCLCLYLCLSCRCRYFCGCCLCCCSLSLCACAKSQRLRFLVCL